MWNPNSTVNVDKLNFEKIINFIESLEDDDDVQKVYSNFEVDENIIKELAS